MKVLYRSDQLPGQVSSLYSRKDLKKFLKDNFTSEEMTVRITLHPTARGFFNSEFLGSDYATRDQIYNYSKEVQRGVLDEGEYVIENGKCFIDGEKVYLIVDSDERDSLSYNASLMKTGSER